MGTEDAFEAEAGPFGVVRREQLLARGVSRGALRHAVDRGRLVELFSGVFVRPGALRDEQRLFAALVLAGNEAVVSHETAAALFKFAGFSLRPFHLSTLRRVSLTDDFVIHRARTSGTNTLQGLRVTSLARTILDCAANRRGVALELMLDDAHHRFSGVEGRLREELRRLKRLSAVPGAHELSRLLDLRGGQASESSEELRLWRLLRRSALPPFSLQHEIRDTDGSYVMTVDFAWVAHRVAVHFDSYRWHARRVTFDTDARQRSRLNALGWENVVVTKATLDSGQCLDDLARVLMRRDPQLRLNLTAP